MKQYKWYLILLGVIAILIIAFSIAMHRIKVLKANDGKVIRDTTTVVKYDTIKITKPKYITQKIIDTMLVPVRDTIRLNDTTYITLPITQKEYKKDSLYRVLVSGYKPNLDLIEVYPKTITQTITNTVYKKPTKFGIGFSAGYGIGLSNPAKPAPFIGVSLNYNLIRF